MFGWTWGAGPVEWRAIPPTPAASPAVQRDGRPGEGRQRDHMATMHVHDDHAQDNMATMHRTTWRPGARNMGHR
jgi:hypothetical protein